MDRGHPLGRPLDPLLPALPRRQPRRGAGARGRHLPLRRAPPPPPAATAARRARAQPRARRIELAALRPRRARRPARRHPRRGPGRRRGRAHVRAQRRQPAVHRGAARRRASTAAAPLPPSLREALLLRVERLPAASQRLLRLLAVAGRAGPGAARRGRRAVETAELSARDARGDRGADRGRWTRPALRLPPRAAARGALRRPASRRARRAAPACSRARSSACAAERRRRLDRDRDRPPLLLGRRPAAGAEVGADAPRARCSACTPTARRRRCSTGRSSSGRGSRPRAGHGHRPRRAAHPSRARSLPRRRRGDRRGALRAAIEEIGDDADPERARVAAHRARDLPVVRSARRSAAARRQRRGLELLAGGRGFAGAGRAARPAGPLPAPAGPLPRRPRRGARGARGHRAARARPRASGCSTGSAARCSSLGRRGGARGSGSTRRSRSPSAPASATTSRPPTSTTPTPCTSPVRFGEARDVATHGRRAGRGDDLGRRRRLDPRAALHPAQPGRDPLRPRRVGARRRGPARRPATAIAGRRSARTPTCAARSWRSARGEHERVAAALDDAGAMLLADALEPRTSPCWPRCRPSSRAPRRRPRAGAGGRRPRRRPDPVLQRGRRSGIAMVAGGRRSTVQAEVAVRARDLGDDDGSAARRARPRRCCELVRAAAEEAEGRPVEAALRAVAEAELARAEGEDDPALWRAAAAAWERLERALPGGDRALAPGAGLARRAATATAAAAALADAAEVAERLGAVVARRRGGGPGGARAGSSLERPSAAAEPERRARGCPVRPHAARAPGARAGRVGRDQPRDRRAPLHGGEDRQRPRLADPHQARRPQPHRGRGRRPPPRDRRRGEAASRSSPSAPRARRRGTRSAARRPGSGRGR